MINQSVSNKRFFNLAILVLITTGFMVKLPAVFYRYDKELHAAFYFFAAIYFGLQFPKKWLLDFFCLLIFGFGIELAQAFSNKISIRLLGRPIHGRFDIKDIRYNIKGLFWGSLVILLMFKIKGIFFKRWGLISSSPPTHKPSKPTQRTFHRPESLFPKGLIRCNGFCSA